MLIDLIQINILLERKLSPVSGPPYPDCKVVQHRIGTFLGCITQLYSRVISSVSFSLKFIFRFHDVPSSSMRGLHWTTAFELRQIFTYVNSGCRLKLVSCTEFYSENLEIIGLNKEECHTCYIKSIIFLPLHNFTMHCFVLVYNKKN